MEGEIRGGKGRRRRYAGEARTGGDEWVGERDAVKQREREMCFSRGCFAADSSLCVCASLMLLIA